MIGLSFASVCVLTFRIGLLVVFYESSSKISIVIFLLWKINGRLLMFPVPPVKELSIRDLLSSLNAECSSIECESAVLLKSFNFNGEWAIVGPPLWLSSSFLDFCETMVGSLWLNVTNLCRPSPLSIWFVLEASPAPTTLAISVGMAEWASSPTASFAVAEVF